MTCNTLKIFPKDHETFDFFYNKTVNSTHRSGDSFKSNSRILDSNSYFNLNKKNENSRKLILFTQLNDFAYLKKNRHVLKRTPIKTCLFYKAKEQSKKFFYCPYKSWYPTILKIKNHSNTSRNLCELNHSSNKTASSFLNSLRDIKIKCKNRSRNQTFSKNSINNFSKTDEPKKFEVHNILNFNSNTGVNSISNLDKYAKDTPNLSFGKKDLFMNYVKSRERMSYIKKYLNELENECINNDTKKQLVIEKDHIKNTYKLYKFYLAVNDKYLINLKTEIAEQSGINYNLVKKISRLEDEVTNLNNLKCEYLLEIIKYTQAKKFLKKIRKYIFENIKSKDASKCDEKINEFFTKKNEDFSKNDYLDIVLTKLRQKTIVDSKIEMPLREFIVFENLIKDNIGQLLEKQAELINEYDSLKEIYNIESKNLEKSDKNSHNNFNVEFKLKQHKLKHVITQNQLLTKKLKNLKNKYHTNNKKKDNSKMINKIKKLYYYILSENKIFDNDENAQKVNYKKDGLEFRKSKNNIFIMLAYIEKSLLFLIKEKGEFMKNSPQKYLTERRKVLKLKSELNAKENELKSKKLKESKLLEKFNKVYFTGFKKDYLAKNSKNKHKENSDSKNEAKDDEDDSFY